MEYREDDFLMLSGIQHFIFCRRQWALIHIEQQWKENEHTIVGELLHKKAHDPYLAEKRGDVMISRALPVYSRSMGVSGECDIVEFHRAEDGIGLHGHRGLFRVFPAQAMCLEEMLSARIEAGALYYGEIHRRNMVEITDELRKRVRDIFQEMHELYDKGYTPRVRWSKSCNACSMKDICMPKLGKASPVRDYIRGKIEEDV